MSQPSSSARSRDTRILLAFASVYLFWGSTYLAIHVAGEHLPVPVVAACRSLLSTALIILICFFTGRSMRVPKGEGWRLALAGLLFMSANNMLLTWGEKMVPSGFAALVVCSTPIMIGIIEVLMVMSGRSGEPLNKRGWAGTLIGMAGIAVLVLPSIRAELAHKGIAGYSNPTRGVIVLLGAAIAFATGSVFSRRCRFQADTLVATGWQIGSAGLFNLCIALVSGGFHRAAWTWQGATSIVYLSIFGSLFGLVAFTYLLQNVAVTKVSTYAFVNPMIAVLLGFLILHERMVRAQLLGMGIIVAGVAMVVFSRLDLGKREIVGTSGQAVE
ncbi:Permease of the drug/metabolite transporter (DMT) superfamily [Bryocella elongata]|uniref:Permease of the drug/metabolite transporter (DMT) superfamily n=1 Tax=Bryocella elongata TaxID=863522 RepID=A0A1H6BQ80_9BACT|nr:EamA family transporter [Bryocella elongata]SEG62792.1 Permease of the drug/metabolite transporter (DMT) superfamily [Bryocella elongata]